MKSQYFYLFCFALISLGCEGYYSSGKNPYGDIDVQAVGQCGYDETYYDKSLLPPEDFGKIGYVTRPEQYPRAKVLKTYLDNNEKILNIDTEYISLCKDSSIENVLLNVINQEGKIKSITREAKNHYSGEFTFRLDSKLDECFFRFTDDYKVLVWANNEDGNTYFANQKTISTTFDIKPKTRSIQANITSSYVDLLGKYQVNSQGVIDEVFFTISSLRNSNTATFTQEDFDEDTRMRFIDYRVFSETGDYTISTKLTKRLPSCNAYIHGDTYTTVKNIKLAPTAILSIEDNATHVLGFNMRYKKNYQSSIDKQYFTLGSSKKEVDDSYYEYIKEKPIFIRAEYYVINDKTVQSNVAKINKEYN